MLTADLVDARKTKDGELLLRTLDHDGRVEARAIARDYIETAQSFVGKTREELEEAWDAVISDDVAARRLRVAMGLRKLILDECTFESETEHDPIELRRQVFTRASEVRKSLAEGEHLDRDKVLAEQSEKLGVSPDVVMRMLFADLKGEQVLKEVPASLDAARLVDAWELGQTQAVLLSAVRVTCEVKSASSGLVRELFRKLKFHQLLFTAERIETTASTKIKGPTPTTPDPTDKTRPEPKRDKYSWRIVIDGPFSMFDAVTKYGVRLALAWPALRQLEDWSLMADVKWGKAREPLIFKTSSVHEAAIDSAKRAAQDAFVPPPSKDVEVELHIADDVRELADAINDLEAGWKAEPANVVLDVPGKGVCIPDLVLTRAPASSEAKKSKKKSASKKWIADQMPDPDPSTSSPIYIEVMGYWSRDAVWKRVELAQSGLTAHVIFAVSSRLRVSEEVLEDDAASCLYVYKGKMSARAIVDRATKLLAK